MDDSNPKKLRTVKRLQKMVVIDDEGSSSIESNIVTEQVAIREVDRQPIPQLVAETKKGFFAKFTHEQVIQFSKKGFRIYLCALLIVYGGLIILKSAGFLNRELK